MSQSDLADIELFQEGERRHARFHPLIAKYFQQCGLKSPSRIKHSVFCRGGVKPVESSARPVNRIGKFPVRNPEQCPFDGGQWETLDVGSRRRTSKSHV